MNDNVSELVYSYDNQWIYEDNSSGYCTLNIDISEVIEDQSALCAKKCDYNGTNYIFNINKNKWVDGQPSSWLGSCTSANEGTEGSVCGTDLVCSNGSWVKKQIY